MPLMRALVPDARVLDHSDLTSQLCPGLHRVFCRFRRPLILLHCVPANLGRMHPTGYSLVLEPHGTQIESVQEKRLHTKSAVLKRTYRLLLENSPLALRSAVFAVHRYRYWPCRNRVLCMQLAKRSQFELTMLKVCASQFQFKVAIFAERFQWLPVVYKTLWRNAATPDLSLALIELLIPETDGRQHWMVRAAPTYRPPQCAHLYIQTCLRLSAKRVVSPALGVTFVRFPSQPSAVRATG